MTKGEIKELNKLIESWKQAKSLAENSRNQAGYDDARALDAEIETYTSCIESLVKKISGFHPT